MKITIFGDICPTKDTQADFDRRDAKAIFGDTLAEIESSDIVLGNLECAVTDNPKPIKKAGPVLFTNTGSIKALDGFTALSLANNHIRDCGDEGVTTAIKTCENLGIITFGAGPDLASAKEPIVIERGGIRIGLMSFAEQEFNTATDSRPGSSYLDLYYDFDRIREFRQVVDYLILLYHGGIEYFPYASPELKKRCHKFVECGADLVSCQHSHCIGTIEKFKNATIVYGQGNSVFGYRKGDASWNSGLLLQVELDGNHHSVSVKGMIFTECGLRFMNSEEQTNLSVELEQRAKRPESEVTKEWDAFCENLGKIHLPLLLGWPKIMIAINRRTNNLFVKLFINDITANNVHNVLRCESHREVEQQILSKYNY